MLINTAENCHVKQFEFAANAPLKTSAKIHKIASHLTAYYNSLKKTPYILGVKNTQSLLANE